MHPINALLDKRPPKKDCAPGCKHYRFDHLDCACCLSEVWSVNKGQPCAIYAELIATDNKIKDIRL